MAYHLFERYGIELEYMIVDRDTFRVAPLTDKVLEEVNGSIVNEVAMDDNIAWSNELALHVIELKVAEPVETLDNLAATFHQNVQKINAILLKHNACLMGGPMHPFMDPLTEMRLWPHDYSPIYDAFDRIFSCKGHGWANLQSMHINLPFANDDEFGRLHAAIRLVLPIIPALSAGSPFADGKVTGFHDTRMETYRTNSKKIPSITGLVIPEAVFTQAEYEKNILNKIYQDLSYCDPQKVLQEEWVNARGAIARFERNTIEIRVIDVQETPFADCAIAALVIETIRMLVNEQVSSFSDQKKIGIKQLSEIFLKTIHYGEAAVVRDRAFLGALGLSPRSCNGSELWKILLGKILENSSTAIKPHLALLQQITTKGSLASRLLSSVSNVSGQEPFPGICKKMCGCLRDGTLFNSELSE